MKYTEKQKKIGEYNGNKLIDELITCLPSFFSFKVNTSNAAAATATLSSQLAR